MNPQFGNDAPLIFDDFGPRDGAPVILIHGHPFNRTMWAPQTAALTAAGYRVIAPDLRGYGESPVRPGVVLLADLADDLAALLGRLGIEQAVVGGVSMGGQIAMETRLRHPGLVRALVLSDTSPVPESEDGKQFRRELAERLLAEGMAPYAEEVIDKMLAPYNVSGMPEAAARVGAMMRATDPEGAAAALRGRAERPDYRPVLAGATEPCLVLVGADDVYTPVVEAEALHALMPHSVLAVIERAGHLPGVEQPEAFNRALLGFLAGL
ncbi:alpha/beta fold hydrolase [Streptomyces sp. NBC_01408]|uniref:alpha/beta fold hydrolase n=1 Tax=Streptomyces sp. NBC_01408 TaxID=2903855 RepID=UPI002254B015|nr:alpha/beta fold hydrolase [Streptomyces sp. NBC_01408]MCX4695256.1 alpha/beta hydrolase [Streptomyces sp. NBC_01408]